MLIESQRSIIEELDTIELCILERFVRNPNLFDENFNSDSRNKFKSNFRGSFKQNLLQRHEISVFLERYKKKSADFLLFYENNKNKVLEEITEIDDKNFNFETFSKCLNMLKKKNQQNETDYINEPENLYSLYAMYSSIFLDDKTDSNNDHDKNKYQIVFNKKTRKDKTMIKRKYITSAYFSHFNLENLFTKNESYGKYFDLENFYEIFKSNFDVKNISYFEYLNLFDKLSYNEIKSNHDVYFNYISKLLEYLISFVKRSKPLFNISGFLNELNESFGLTCLERNYNNDSNKNNEIYCDICKTFFKKKTVFDYHLEGKKHKKNKIRSNQDSNTINQNKLKKKVNIKLIEFKIKMIVEHFNDIKIATISNIERKIGMTEKEIYMEEFDNDLDDSKYSTLNSSFSESCESDYSNDSDCEKKNCFLSVDGKPIPYWLYKLQGLHKFYNCEICGNLDYKGKNQFIKHFNTSMHQKGLRCLGIEEDSLFLFNNIPKIDDATKLWTKIKKDKRIKDVDEKNIIEVEDDDGNVLSKGDYLELKKQGLL